MSIKDKLEIGLKPDAPYRKDNLPEAQQSDAACQDAEQPGEGDAVNRARNSCDEPEGPPADKQSPVRRGPDQK
ncbi:MAG: hypothetical protein ABI051_09725 [Vicinamibacterales bacterium]